MRFMSRQERHAHAVLDLRSRGWKAEKIARLLRISDRSQPVRLLEVGTGSGGIAHWFAHHPDLRCEVTAVDVRDSRLVQDGYRFVTVADTKLPFGDACFDVVVSNHVIEHVGDVNAQMHHLAELRRVMCGAGVCYLAVPNRWMLIEPHYRLAFLSWWPRGLRSSWLRLWRKGEFYDCEPLEMQQLERMLAASRLAYANLCVEAWRATFDIERPGRLATRLLKRVPDAVLRVLDPINPTLIYRIERSHPQADEHQ